MQSVRLTQTSVVLDQLNGVDGEAAGL